MNLAIYACHPSLSKGRKFQEEESLIRNAFQRDRDRIIHSSSFRRLQYKTQVFVNHEGDMFRSRLTHSLEVSQIARGIARTLHCHEDLAEAIALAHDLGHTPFGHAGQDALNACMKDFGGFEHNLQSLRVVDVLEKKYANFNGLNLTFEVREGILKHCSKKNAQKLGDLGKRFIMNRRPSIEAQIVNLADEIAYLHHDLDDGFRSEILTFEKMMELPLFEKFFKAISNSHQLLSSEQKLHETLRLMMNSIISDLCHESFKNIKKFNPQSVEDVRGHKNIVCFSDEMGARFMEIKQFSRINLYEHPRIQEMSFQAKNIIKSLFAYFHESFNQIPDNFKTLKDQSRERAIADYVAGMTDRFANNLYKSINKN